MQKYSVALCTYNGSPYVRKQLESIINQTVKPSQIIISDDGSTDNTIDIVKQILEETSIDYSIVYNVSSHGVSQNFRNAFSYCVNPIIFCSDQDDVWDEKKAEIMLRKYDDNPKAMLVFSDGFLVDKNLNSLGGSVWDSVGITNKRLIEGDWFHYLIKNCLITGAAMSFKKELINDMVLIPKEWLHDGWLTWVALSRNGLIPCNSKLFYYRQHNNNVIGMQPKTNYFGRIIGWRKNFSDVKNTRRIRHDRYLSLLKILGDKFNSKQRKEIKNCIFFWQDMIESESMSIIKSFFIYTKHLANGNYSNYYNGFRGYLRDVILLFHKV